MSRCALKGCNRYGALHVFIMDMADPELHIVDKDFCCKTHMLRYLQKRKWPRYSNKRVQRLLGTLMLKGIRRKEETP